MSLCSFRKLLLELSQVVFLVFVFFIRGLQSEVWVTIGHPLGIGPKLKSNPLEIFQDIPGYSPGHFKIFQCILIPYIFTYTGLTDHLTDGVTGLV